MEALAGPLAVAAALLVVSGAAKVVRPIPVVLAMRAVGIPSPRFGGRLLGLMEMSLGAWALVATTPIAALAVGVFYLLFAGFLVLSLRRGDAASCGCFGAAASPPGPVHVVLDLGFGVLAIAAAAVGSRSAFDVVSAEPGRGAAFVLLVGIGVGAAMAAFTGLAEVNRLVRDARVARPGTGDHHHPRGHDHRSRAIPIRSGP